MWLVGKLKTVPQVHYTLDYEAWEIKESWIYEKKVDLPQDQCQMLQK